MDDDASSKSSSDSNKNYPIILGKPEDGTKLCKVGYADIVFFNFGNYSGPVKVVDIYDGDTCTIVFPYLGTLCKYRARLAGINTPEIRAKKTDPEYQAKKHRALEARNRLIYLILWPESLVKKDGDESQSRKLWTTSGGKREVRSALRNNHKLNYCDIVGFEKYGRLLVNLHLNGEIDSPLVNDILITEGYAVPYIS